MPINNQIINQKGTPAFYSDIFANRPAFGYAGRVFISTDTGAIYEDTGTAWTLIADAGAGTTGTLQQVTTNGNTTNLGIVVQGLNISKGTGTGGANTGVGINTLQSNTTGSLNTALGNQALFANTTGAFNTAIGNGALVSNTTANSNTAVGNVSLNANTTGANNTAIGATSLQLNTTGGSNTAVGYQSLNANTTGANNTALGLSALSGNTTASFNTAIGSSSLLNNTTGTQNTAVGYQSLNANTTGANNTALGNAAGSLITTGSNNTIIGNYAGTSTLASNIILADGNGNVRLFSDANGLIAINQAVGSVPGGQLDIHTTQTYALVLNGLSTSNAYTAFSNANVGKWRIGNTYNAGANSFDIFNLTSSAAAMSITSNSAVLINSTTDDTINKLQVNGGIASTKFETNFNSTTINSSTNVNTAVLDVGIVCFRDATNGGGCVVFYENGQTPIIISQSGPTSYTTLIPPTATQIQISDRTGSRGLQALGGSSRNGVNLIWAVFRIAGLSA